MSRVDERTAGTAVSRVDERTAETSLRLAGLRVQVIGINMLENKTGKITRANHGVALVLVLGMVSLMTVLAVAFAISMRVERLAAGNYSDIVKSRELVQVALARALDHINTNLGGGLVDGGVFYPDWLVLWSTNDPGTNAMGDVNNLLVRKTDNYTEGSRFVPDALWVDAEDAAPEVEWILLSTTNVTEEAGGEEGEDDVVVTNVFLHGRIGYMVLNTSGLLDLNEAGRPGAERGVGTNISEIKLDELESNWTDGGGANDFLNARDASGSDLAGPYLTLPEAVEMTGVWTDDLKPPVNFVTYSRSIPCYWDAGETNPAQKIKRRVNLAGDIPSRKTAIEDAFANIGFSDPTNKNLYTALLDYVDNSHVGPTDVKYGTKPVPMFNEFAFECTETEPFPGVFEYTLIVYAELWYPFLDAPERIVDVELEFGIVQYPTNSVSFTVPGEIMNQDDIRVLNYSDTISGPPPLTIRLVKAKISEGGAVLDELEGGRLFQTNGVQPHINSLDSKVSFECNDPRFNYNVADENCWSTPRTTPAQQSLGAPNKWNTRGEPGTDTDTAMYVAQRPLKSVGELGYLPYAPWKTIKLYGDDRHAVLDVFGICTNSANPHVGTRRGPVNPNTTITNVLASVFMDMPVDQYPGEVVLSKMLWPDAQEAAEIIIDETHDNGVFTNLSDIGRVDWGSFMGGAATNELIRESFIRNTAGMLDVGQNLFTILLAAEVASEDGFAKYPARQSAVATVWRDPYSGKLTVVQLKMLKD